MRLGIVDAGRPNAVSGMASRDAPRSSLNISSLFEDVIKRIADRQAV